MPKRIAKKLKEMKEKAGPSAAKNHPGAMPEPKCVSPQGTREPVEVIIKFASLSAGLQKKIISLMQAILDIGKAADKIYGGNQSPFIYTYFSPIVNSIDLAKTLSSFQTVFYSTEDLPILDGVFWPGQRGKLLSEVSFRNHSSTIYAFHYNMEQTSEAWSEVSAHIQFALSTWEDGGADVSSPNSGFLAQYWWEEPIYQKALTALDSKVDHLISAVSQITWRMNEWAENRRELVIEREAYDDILSGCTEEEIDVDIQ